MDYLNPYEKIERHRNYLPHWQQDDVFVFVTWRLADSIPKATLSEWMEQRDIWLKIHPRPWDENTEMEYHDRFSRRLDEWLDAGCGACVLRDSGMAAIVASALHYFDGERYDLDAFVVMPNHVHVLFRPATGHGLKDIIKSWKGFTARAINKQLSLTGSVWQEDYWDRLIRNERHLFKCREYIRKNPEKSGLRKGEYVLFEQSGAGMPPLRLWERGHSCPPLDEKTG
jgi:REP element-mobilizing transposase RayT